MRTSKRTSKLDLKLIVYNLIKQGLSPKDICKKLNWKYSKLHYYTKQLEEEQLIKKVGYGTWETTSKTHHDTNNTHPLNPKEIRSHAFIFTLKIPKIHRWNDRKSFLETHNIPHKDIPQGQRISFDYYSTTYKIWLCNNSIVIYFPKGKDYLVNKAQTGYLKSIYDFKKIVKSLEKQLGTSFLIDKKYQFKVSRREHSNINNALAKHYNNKKQKFQCRDDEGVLWLIIDDSFHLDELEVVNTSKGVSHEKIMDNAIMPFFNDLKENPIKPSQILKGFKYMQEIQEKEIKKMSYYNDNWVSHIAHIKEQGQATVVLSKAVVELNTEVKKIRNLLSNQPISPQMDESKVNHILSLIKTPLDILKPEIKQLVLLLSSEEKSLLTKELFYI